MVKPTQVHAALEQGASRLLGIEGLAVARVELEDDGTRVAHVVTDDECAAACPSCGVFSSSLKGYAITRPRDVPYEAVVVSMAAPWPVRTCDPKPRAAPRRAAVASAQDLVAAVAAAGYTARPTPF